MKPLLEPRLLWKKFTSDSSLGVRWLQSVAVACGVAAGVLAAFTLLKKAFYIEIGFGFREFHFACLTAAVLCLFYIFEPFLWRLFLKSDEQKLSSRFLFHAWPALIWIPVSLIFSDIDRRFILAPFGLMFFNRLSYALRNREKSSTWSWDEPVFKYFAVGVVILFCMSLMGQRDSEYVIVAYILWLLSLIAFPSRERRAVVIESFIFSTPFVLAAVLGSGRGLDEFLILAAFLFVCGVFMVCSLKKHRARFYAVVMWAAVFLAVVVMEFAVRQTHYEQYLRPRQVGHDMLPDDLLFYVPKGMFPGVDERKVATMNFRSGKISVPKTPGIKRIVCMGGSSTWGRGVNQYETWPAFLNGMIRADGIDAEVVNAGVEGYTSFQILILMHYYMLQFSPDAVILYVGHNDLAHSYGSYSDRELWEMTQGERGRYGLVVTRAQKLLGRLRLYNAARIAVAGIKRDGLKMDQVSASRPNEFVANVRDIYELLRERDIPLLLMAEAMQLEDDIYHEGLGELAGRIHVPFRDVYMDIRVKPNGEKLFIDDVHLTPDGNREVARHAFALLTEAGVIP